MEQSWLMQENRFSIGSNTWSAFSRGPPELRVSPQKSLRDIVVMWWSPAKLVHNPCLKRRALKLPSLPHPGTPLGACLAGNSPPGLGVGRLPSNPDVLPFQVLLQTW